MMREKCGNPKYQPEFVPGKTKQPTNLSSRARKTNREKRSEKELPFFDFDYDYEDNQAADLHGASKTFIKGLKMSLVQNKKWL